MKLKLGIALFAVLVVAFVLFAFFIETDGFGNDYVEQTTTEEETLGELPDPASHPYGDWYIYRDETTGDAGLGMRDCTLDNCDCYDMRTVSKGLAYSVNDDGKTCTITGIGECSDSIIIIPFVIDGYEVVKISDKAFLGCAYMSGLAIPSTVVEIGEKAFFACSSLGGIIIPNGTVSIGNYAFGSCSKIKNVLIPESVTHIGDGAFADTPKLESISVDESNMVYTSINGSLYTKGGLSLVRYTNAKASTEFIAPDSVVEIKEKAFSSSANLVSITLPEGVKSIGSLAFDNCSALKTLNIPTSLEDISDSAFDGFNIQYNEYENACYLGNSENPYIVLISAKSNEITECDIPDGTKFIYTNAFMNCKSLLAIAIPDGLVSVGGGAFDGCSAITSISLPATVTNIGDGAFAYCNSLESISVADGCESYHSINGNLYSTSNSTLIAYALGKSDKEFSIPEGVKAIGSRAFEGNVKLTSISIPESLESIDANAYDYLKKIQSIAVAESNSAYKVVDGCLMSYDGKTFILYTKGADNTEFSIPEGVTIIGENAFSSATKLESISIPDSVTTISDGAFKYCSKLLSVTIPNSVTSIGNSAFWNCSELASVSIGNSVLTIGESAFNRCKKLEFVTIPNSVTSLGGSAFWDCTSLRGIVIGKNVKSIGSSALGNCSSLEVIYYHGSESNWNSIAKNQNNTVSDGTALCFYSEAKPSTEGGFWHYVDGAPTKW